MFSSVCVCLSLSVVFAYSVSGSGGSCLGAYSIIVDEKLCLTI